MTLNCKANHVLGICLAMCGNDLELTALTAATTIVAQSA